MYKIPLVLPVPSTWLYHPHFQIQNPELLVTLVLFLQRLSYLMRLTSRLYHLLAKSTPKFFSSWTQVWKGSVSCSVLSHHSHRQSWCTLCTCMPPFHLWLLFAIRYFMCSFGALWRFQRMLWSHSFGFSIFSRVLPFSQNPSSSYSQYEFHLAADSSSALENDPDLNPGLTKIQGAIIYYIHDAPKGSAELKGELLFLQVFLSKWNADETAVHCLLSRWIGKHRSFLLLPIPLPLRGLNNG